MFKQKGGEWWGKIKMELQSQNTFLVQITTLTSVNGKNSCTLLSTSLRGISILVVYVTS